MAGRQRSLTLIPPTLMKSTGPKPPMTSKAAKKAYQQANRVPRISRAEQRKLEAEEIKRLNEEHEKERAAAKAKAAREKKTEKVKAEKAARRKSGLPEPSRHVRPSQPTISLFVGKGNKRTWAEMEDPMRNKRIRAKKANTTEDVGEELSVKLMDKIYEEPEEQELRKSNDPEVEFGDSLNNSEPIDSSASSTRGTASTSPPRKRLTLTSSAGTSIRQMENTEFTRACLEDADEFGDMPSTQLLSEVAEALLGCDHSKRLLPNVANDLVTTCQPKGDLSPEKTASAASISAKPCCQKSEIQLTKPRPPLQERPINMPPPPPPPLPRPSLKIKNPVAFTPPPPKYQSWAQGYLAPARASYPDAPPSSTQIFIENNLEDFFPSSTQEVRELDGEPQPMLPRNFQLSKAPSRNAITIGFKDKDDAKEDSDPFLNFICTQDLAVSSQDLLEITTSSRGRLSFESAAGSAPAGSPSLPIAPPTFLPLTYISPNPTAPQFPPPPSPKRPFFEEKEQDLLSAALHESKVLAANHNVSQCCPRENYRQEQENVGGPRREDGKRRGLQRIQSTATDYGDDEFRGCSQELLALC